MMSHDEHRKYLEMVGLLKPDDNGKYIREAFDEIDACDLQKRDEMLALNQTIASMDSRFQRLFAETQQLKEMIDEMRDVMHGSTGVAGLHLNGETATWEWLVENGWLSKWR
jgi:hypothetical protein